MKIGIVGWYGHENLGDERILHCLRLFLSQHEMFVLGDWGEARAELDMLNRCDYVLFGGGGIILRGCNAFVDILDRLKVPFSFIGVSVEAVHRDMDVFLQVMKDKAERIVVRDCQSLAIIDSPCNAEVAPDLTFLDPFPVLEPNHEDVCGLNLRPWFFWKAQLHGRVHKSMNFLSKALPGLSVAYPFAKWSPDDFASRVLGHFAEVVALPFYFEEGLANDSILMSRFFSEMPDCMEQINYSGLRYLIGMRFHSIVFALQAGIPFLSLSYQPKNNAFCSDIDMQYLIVDLYDWEPTFDSKVSLLKDRFDEIREKLLSCRQEYVVQVTRMMKDFKLGVGAR